MTIRSSVDIRSMYFALGNMRACAENAPDHTHTFAKDFVEEFNDAISAFHTDLTGRMKILGLKISNADAFCEIEALTYGMIKGANPDVSDINVSEGFGELVQDNSMGHSGNTVRENVLAGLTRDREFLDKMNKAKTAADDFVGILQEILDSSDAPKAEKGEL